MIYQFNLESRIPKDHFLRLVESTVDFSFVRDLVREFYSDRGAASVDPVVIFKMPLLGYFYGISSERRADGKVRIVTAVTTTPGAVQEHEEVEALLEKHRFTTHEKPQEVVADAAYGIRKVFALLSRCGVQANIPPRTTHVTARRKKEEAGFRYDADRDVWVCPEGKTLYRMSQSKPPGHTLYMVHTRACATCPRHVMLCKTKRPSIVDSRGDHLLNRVKAYTETAAARETFKRRKCKWSPPSANSRPAVE
jgi:hypothetical protein